MGDDMTQSVATAAILDPSAIGQRTSHGVEQGEKIRQTQERLAQQGVKYCVGAYVDIHGVPKAKVVPLDHLEHMAHGSELYTGYALDGLGQAPNDDEIASVPDLDRIIQLPWEPKIAWMPADNTFRGRPYPLNTRVALKNVLAQAADLGMGLNLGIECEVFVLKKMRTERCRFPIRTTS